MTCLPHIHQEISHEASARNVVIHITNPDRPWSQTLENADC